MGGNCTLLKQADLLDNLDVLVDDGVFLTPWEVVQNAAVLIVSAISAMACILHIYITLTYRHLKTKTNIYLLQYTISSLILLMFIFIEHLIAAINSKIFLQMFMFLCTVVEIHNVLTVLPPVIAALIAVDWAILLLDLSWSDHYEKFRNYTIGFTYALFAFLFIFGLMANCLESGTTSNLLAIDSFTIVLILVINCITYAKGNVSKELMEMKYGLTLSTYISLASIPIKGIALLHPVMPKFLRVIAKLLYVSTPLVVVLWLRASNRDFKKALNIVLRRHSRSEIQCNNHTLNVENIDSV